MQNLAWGLTGAVSLLAAIAWWGIYHSQKGGMTAYSVFPLLGLLGFSVMWAHYMMAAVRQWFGHPKATLEYYFNVTSVLVLVLILLHPGILAWSLWRDGFGLPPGSTKLFVGAALYGYVILGVIALTIFLVYELRRFVHGKRWQKVLQYANDGAMVLILIHGFNLGVVTRTSWFSLLWWFYGVTFVLSLSVRAYLDEKTKEA